VRLDVWNGVHPGSNVHRVTRADATGGCWACKCRDLPLHHPSHLHLHAALLAIPAGAGHAPGFRSSGGPRRHVPCLLGPPPSVSQALRVHSVRTLVSRHMSSALVPGEPELPAVPTGAFEIVTKLHYDSMKLMMTQLSLRAQPCSNQYICPSNALSDVETAY
jgi:hypothetical protein